MVLETISAFHVTPTNLTATNWPDAVAAKRARRDMLIPVEWRLDPSFLDGAYQDATQIVYQCGILTHRELQITELDELEELVLAIAQGIYTSVEVTIAYCKRAVIAQQATNCLTEIYFEQAVLRAAQLDDQLRTTGQVVGPLHGVPISLKDQFDIEGTELTMGYASYLGRVSPRDSSLVRLLTDAGAIIHCRTNVPMTLLDGDTDNNVFGRTLNPLNTALSPGGSSGGEGALVAMKGSILGVGTDIGGSIRIPASFCGLHALRPTSHRVPYGHSTNSQMGQVSVPSVAGPLARSLTSCSYFMRCVLDADPSRYDATALPFPFDSAASVRVDLRRKLAFGVIRTDGYVRPHPPVKRALEEAVGRLREIGHEVIEFDVSDFKGISPTLTALLLADGGEDIRRTLEPISEPLLPHLTFGLHTQKTVYETYQLNRHKETLQQAFLSQWLATVAQTTTGREVDAILLPTTAMTAGKSGDMRWGGYGAFASLLDLPAVAVPFGKVDPAVDVAPFPREPLSVADADVTGSYDPVTTAGMPISLQLVGKRYKDEELLAVAERVVQVLSAPSGAGTLPSPPLSTC
ncbi:hypothetical protein JCM11641_000724 [Rhodosporidiobolus odoratus]